MIFYFVRITRYVLLLGARFVLCVTQPPQSSFNPRLPRCCITIATEHVTSHNRYISKVTSRLHFRAQLPSRVWRQLSQPYTPYSIETKEVITSKTANRPVGTEFACLALISINAIRRTEKWIMFWNRSIQQVISHLLYLRVTIMHFPYFIWELDLSLPTTTSSCVWTVNWTVYVHAINELTGSGSGGVCNSYGFSNINIHAVFPNLEAFRSSMISLTIIRKTWHNSEFLQPLLKWKRNK
jgi:hypothetical protein